MTILILTPFAVVSDSIDNDECIDYGPYVHIRINKRCYFYNLFTKQKTYLRKFFSQDACGGF